MAMALINFKSPILDQLSGAQTRLITMSVNDNLSTVLGAGYLNKLVDVNGNLVLSQVNGVNVNSLQNGGNGLVVNAGDFLFISYSGGQSVFTVGSVSSNVVSLVKGANPYTSDVAITLAQFNAMYTTPILLVPAQGANTLIVLESMVLKQIYGSAALTAGGAVNVQYDNTTHDGGAPASTAVQASDFTGASASTAYFFTGLSGNGVQVAFSACVNKGLYLSNATAVFATGTGSSFIANVVYNVFSSNS